MADTEDPRRYQLHMRSIGASAKSMNAAVSALRFFFTVTLGRDDANGGMTTVHEPRRLPVVLSPDEVARLLEATPGAKYRAALGIAHGAGPRASEAVSLEVSVTNNRTRLQSGGAKEAFKPRAEICERSFVHILDRGGMRRTHLRGREDVHSRNGSLAINEEIRSGVAGIRLPILRYRHDGVRQSKVRCPSSDFKSCSTPREGLALEISDYSS